MYKVMLVDDMEIFRRYLRRLNVWKDPFVITEEAEDGSDALRKLQNNPVDLIFVDIRMPKMDGIEFLKKVAENKPCPCIVLLSDYTEYEYARQGMIHGAFDYISKSLTEEDMKLLLERVKQHLDQRRLEEEKLNRLQEFVEEAYALSPDMKYIVECICKGEEKSSSLIARMMDSILEDFGNDQSKALLLVKNILQEILQEVYAYYPWLKLYYQPRLSYCDNAKDWSIIRIFILDKTCELSALINRFMPSCDNKVVSKTCEYILLNIQDDLSVKAIAEKMYINKAHLCEIFKKKVGTTLLEYITAAKMERAKIMVAGQELKNTDIAYQLSFRDYGYFNRVFKKYTGMTLIQYREQLLREE